MSDFNEKAENRTIIRIDRDGRREEDDLIIKEHALTITLSDGKFVKDRPYVTMFCSPSDMESLGLGFLLSEGIINSIDDVESLSISNDRSELKVCMTDNANLAESLLTKRDITSGCGRNLNPYDFLNNLKIQELSSNLKISADSINQRSSEFQSMSMLYKSTGGKAHSYSCQSKPY